MVCLGLRDFRGRDRVGGRRGEVDEGWRVRHSWEHFVYLLEEVVRCKKGLQLELQLSLLAALYVLRSAIEATPRVVYVCSRQLESNLNSMRS